MPLEIYKWQKTIGGNGFDELYSIQQTSDNGYILGGFSGSSISGDKTEDTLGSIDYWVIKLSPDTITSIHNNITANYNTITLHPNPASQSATLDYSSINENIAALSITNMLGERIAFYRSLPSERLQIQTSSMPKGIYVIELRTETKVIQKKMVVQ